jgi:cell division septum initiation protein DivIVA
MVIHKVMESCSLLAEVDRLRGELSACAHNIVQARHALDNAREAEEQTSARLIEAIKAVCVHETRVRQELLQQNPEAFSEVRQSAVDSLVKFLKITSQSAEGLEMRVNSDGTFDVLYNGSDATGLSINRQTGDAFNGNPFQPVANIITNTAVQLVCSLKQRQQQRKNFSQIVFRWPSI